MIDKNVFMIDAWMNDLINECYVLKSIVITFMITNFIMNVYKWYVLIMIWLTTLYIRLLMKH